MKTGIGTTDHQGPELQQKLDSVRYSEREWQHCRNNGHRKKQLNAKFCTERRAFDRLNRKTKRAYQLNKQSKLSELHKRNSSEMWREIGQMGMAIFPEI